jgi:hypothetical protein
MKPLRLLPFLTLFALFLFWGFRIGAAVNRLHLVQPKLVQWIKTSKPIVPTSFSPSETSSVQSYPLPGDNHLATGQRNILIIGIDRLEAPGPRLEGIWLALYVPTNPKITLMPIYPSLTQNQTGYQANQDSTLTSEFGLDENRKPDSSFLKALQDRGLWWNNFVVLDELAMVQIIDLTNNIGERGDTVQEHSYQLTGIRALADLPLPWENPLAAVLSQAKLLADLCHQAPEVQPAKEVETSIFSDQLSHHMVTDINADQVSKDWSSMMGIGTGISCEFPSLKASLTQR